MTKEILEKANDVNYKASMYKKLNDEPDDFFQAWSHISHDDNAEAKEFLNSIKKQIRDFTESRLQYYNKELEQI